METFLTVLLLVVVAGFASAIMLLTHRTEKRGCGRGCATCPNRNMCHRKGKRVRNK